MKQERKFKINPISSTIPPKHTQTAGTDQTKNGNLICSEQTTHNNNQTDE